MLSRLKTVLADVTIGAEEFKKKKVSSCQNFK